MAKLRIPDVLEFEMSADEMLRITRWILSNTKQGKARTAVVTMLKELKKGNEALRTMVLLPLTTLTNEAHFDARFAGVRKHFKDIYLGDRATLTQMSCGNVTYALQELTRANAWKKKIGFSRAVEELELLTRDWIANDKELFEADERMLKEINRFLDDIAATSNSKARYKNFKEGAADIEEIYRAMRSRLAKLEELANKI